MTKLPVVALIASPTTKEVKVIRGTLQYKYRHNGFYTVYKVNSKRFESIRQLIKASGGSWRIKGLCYAWDQRESLC